MEQKFGVRLWAGAASVVSIQLLAGYGKWQKAKLVGCRKRRRVVKRFLLVLGLFVSLFAFSGCSQADVVSSNISKKADQFMIYRRIIFYNGITGEYMLNIEGYCSLGNFDTSNELTVTCKVGKNEYVKHFLGLSDNVTYFAEQLKATPEDPYRYIVYFRPTTIVPNPELDLP